MTISVNVGNIVHEVKEGIIVQQVNAQGVMGSGVAKDIREKYPQVFEVYSRAVGPAYTQYQNGRHLLGMMIPVQVDTNLWVCNIVGQQFFGRDPHLQPTGQYTSYDALAVGFKSLRHFALENFVLTEDLRWATRPVINFPLIGCGLGGADWNIVSSIIETCLPSFKKTLWVLTECDKPGGGTHPAT